MQIWWGWRLAFDCTCLWGFLHFFSLCKYRDLDSPSKLRSIACVLCLGHRTASMYVANFIMNVIRPNCDVEI